MHPFVEDQVQNCDEKHLRFLILIKISQQRQLTYWYSCETACETACTIPGESPSRQVFGHNIILLHFSARNCGTPLEIGKTYSLGEVAFFDITPCFFNCFGCHQNEQFQNIHIISAYSTLISSFSCITPLLFFAFSYSTDFCFFLISHLCDKL